MKLFLSIYCSLYKVWDQKNISQWEEMKKEGLIKFLIIQGIVKWGILSSAVFISATYWNKPIIINDILTTISIWLWASISYGYCLWCGTHFSYENFHK